MSFDSIGLPDSMLAAIKDIGYKNLTPIQQKAIPAIRKGKDVLASAQTGTGKTAAFALPIVEALIKSKDTSHSLKAIILAPTRELAIQVADNFKQYSKGSDLRVGLAYGGVSGTSQQNMLKKGVDVLVATPGRLLEHLQTMHLHLGQVKYVVLDEADRMLDMGFAKDIEQVFTRLKHKPQTLMFSATFSQKVKLLVKRFLTTPQIIEVAKQNTTSGKIKQQVYWVQESRKRELLSELIGVNNWQQVMVFAGTRESANILAKELKLDGIKAVLCHGEKSQGARQKALAEFVEGKARVMVATDVAARGLDIESLPMVVNYHLPFLAEDYVHRVGRTGRAGKSGHAISLVSPKDEKFLGNIEALVGRQFERLVYPGYEFERNTLDRDKEKVAVVEKKNRYRRALEKNRALAKKSQNKGQSKRAKPRR